MTPSPRTPGDLALAGRLERALEGEVRFDAFTRGLYATDASHYQIEPLGVVFPKSVEDVQAVFEIARSEGVPVLPRGAGTSQGGQTIGRAVVMDTSRWLTAVGEVTDGHVDVEPGVVLDRLNARLRPAGLWFPVDPSTSSRATLGGMAGNNSAGTRSLRYGMMVDNVSAAEVVLADGRRVWVGEGTSDASMLPAEVAALRALFFREAAAIERRTPRVLRNVAGYNLDRLRPDRENLAQLLVGSEGTLAFFSRLRLRVAPLPARRVVGVCHFPGLLPALDSVQHLVALEPSAVELVDRTVLRLASERPDYRVVLERFVRGSPGALLLVEFSGDAGDGALLERRLDDLDARLGELGHPNSVVRIMDRSDQAALWNVRQGGLSIVMSMAGPSRPVSFIEDCAVPLEHLAEYARRVDEIFARHDVEGTWYAHASVGCLHVRPALNLKDPDDVARVRSIADAVHAVVRELGGTHSGEHGDGIVRSEFLRTMLGERMVAAYAEVKRTFDPRGMLNPGKIVDPLRMDDRSLFRYAPGYSAKSLPVVLDWSATGGLLGAVERCDNNGACRKMEPEVMCPSFRVTGDERHSTRGRANGLRLALTGQLGDGGLDSPEMAEALSLCISCKACKRECPTGVDMARLKLEWLHRQNRLRGVPLRERVLAELPRVAARAGRLSQVLNPVSALGARALGISRKRTLPRWARHPWRDDEIPKRDERREPADVVLFVDTFTRWFEPENAHAARRVLERGGWTAVTATPQGGGRPLCCGRTYLSAGMLDEARTEARRTVAALAEHAKAGRPIVGLEPSCLYTLADEVVSLVPGDDARAVAKHAMLLEELVEREWANGRELPFASGVDRRQVLVHGHCHQKAHGGARFTLDVLRRVPRLDVQPIESSCCGMAGAFGYHAEHYDVSMRMGELSLFPAVRAAPAATIVADGTSCRTQIADGTGRRAVHAAVMLEEATRG